ncbi:MAG: hypothetical protein HY547_01860 [Elusimicrobia bacterium]|nr:hypothetical protein [Elusimicrobiota bacterium]
MRSAIIALLSIAFGFLLAFWIFFQNPPAPLPTEQPPVIFTDINGIPEDISPGKPFVAAIALRAETTKPLTTQIDAHVIGPNQALFDLGSKVVIFQPMENPEPQNFTFSNTPESATGPYRFRVKAMQIKSDGSKKLILETERAFWISAVAPPPAPLPPAAPPATPKPAPRKKAPPPGPPPKPTAPIIEIKAVSKTTTAEFGKDFVISVSVVNKGDGLGQVVVETWGEPTDLLPKKIWGPVAIKPGESSIIDQTYALAPEIIEGPHEIKLAAYVDGSPNPASESSVPFNLMDAPPLIFFRDPPLKNKMGLPVSFIAEAADDRGIKAVVFYLISAETSPVILPMKLTEGNKLRGAWNCSTTPLKNPGQYAFYAEAEDIKGQKKKTEDLGFVITVR